MIIRSGDDDNDGRQTGERRVANSLCVAEERGAGGIFLHISSSSARRGGKLTKQIEELTERRSGAKRSRRGTKGWVTFQFFSFFCYFCFSCGFAFFKNRTNSLFHKCPCHCCSCLFCFVRRRRGVHKSSY